MAFNFYEMDPRSRNSIKSQSFNSAFVLYCERKISIKSKMLSKVFLKTCFGNETKKLRLVKMKLCISKSNFTFCIFTVFKN